MRTSKFTLMEILFVVTILAILITIGVAAGNKVMKKQAESKTKAELKIIMSACLQYGERFDTWPIADGVQTKLDFYSILSPIHHSDHAPHFTDLGKLVPMFFDYKKNHMTYEEDFLIDPYGNPYMVKRDEDTLIIWSTRSDDFESFTPGHSVKTYINQDYSNDIIESKIRKFN